MSVTRHSLAYMLVLIVAASVPAAAQDKLPDALVTTLQTTPVHFTGRVMPLERASRIIVRRFSGRRSIDEYDQSRWLVRLLLRPFSAIHDKAFLVDDPGALDAIGFPDAGRARYSYAELYPFLPTVDSFAAALEAVDRPLDATERAIVSLAARVRLFEGLASTLDVFRAAEGASEYEQWLSGDFETSDATIVGGMIRIVPVPALGEAAVRWRAPAFVLANRATTNREVETSGPSPVETLLAAWNQLAERPSEAAAARVSDVSRDLAFSESGRAAFVAELLYLSLAPRLLAMAVAALLLLLAALPGRLRQGRAITAGLLLVVLSLEQTLRVVITGRPPVVTLGGALLFLGWALTLWSFVGALRAAGTGARKNAVRRLSGSVFPVISVGLIVESSADPFAVVQAVLDTNLWLTVHIGTIAVGYLAVIAAALLSEWYLIREVRRPGLATINLAWYRRARIAALVGLTFTALGTLLGGFWADQSWGRFWGWDPKESGALLIILWLSLVLHLKQNTRRSRELVAGGLVFGLAVLLFAWVGVNALGIGLHSYGLVSSSLFIVLAGVVVAGTAASVSLWLAARRTSDRSASERVIHERSG